MNIPPEGAQSADSPFTKFDYLLNAFEQASQAPEPAKLNYGDKRRALYAHVRELERRAALAAPEGPAPSPVTRKDGSMSFEEAQDLARKHAKAEPESYYSEPFEPHLWVINAIVEASAHWYQRAVDERVRRVKESNSRAPEAPPPVEAGGDELETLRIGDKTYRVHVDVVIAMEKLCHRAALAADRRHYTYVDRKKVASKNPGYCFIAAGWRRCGTTAGGLLVLERIASGSDLNEGTTS